jgi:hypothetical protein
MEGISLILIGTAIFTHSWYQLGLYADGRTVGILMAGLAVALVVSLFAFEPQFLGTLSANDALKEGETTVLRSLMISWAVYMAAIAAQGFWDLDERAIGFYGILLTALSIIALLFFLQVWINTEESALMVPFVVSGALLSVVGALLFFSMAIPFPGLRSVSGWAMLLESIVIAGIGMAMITTVISA